MFEIVERIRKALTNLVVLPELGASEKKFQKNIQGSEQAVIVTRLS